MGVLRWVRELFAEPGYITDGHMCWVFTGKNYNPTRRDLKDAVRVGSFEWAQLCCEEVKMRYYTDRTGMLILKRDPPYRLYWRGYHWPVRGFPPAKVYIGRLDRYSSARLEAKMTELVKRSKEKRKKYLAEKARRKREKRQQRQRRWKLKTRKQSRHTGVYPKAYRTL